MKVLTLERATTVIDSNFPTKIYALNTGSSKMMDGIVYLDLLEQYVFPQIETFEQEIVSRIIFK